MSRRKRWFRFGIAGLIVGLVAGAFAASWLERTELRNEIALAKSEGLPLEPADLRRVSVPDAENASPDLLRAWALLHSRFLTEYQRIDTPTPGGSIFGVGGPSPSDFGALASLQPVMECLHEAAQKRYMDFHRRWEDGPDAQFGFGDVRTDVKLLLADARRQDHIGRPDIATREWTDASRLSCLISQEPDLTAAYTTLGCDVLIENEIESWMVGSRIRPGMGPRVKQAIEAMGPLPDVRRSLSGQLVLMRQGIRELANTSMRTLMFQSGRLRSFRFAHIQQVRDAYDIRVIQGWRDLYRTLPADTSNLLAVQQKLDQWARQFLRGQDWTYDYLHAMSYGLANLAFELEAQLARQRVLLTLAELLEMEADGKPFDGHLSRATEHMDPCTGELLQVAQKPGGWIVSSLGPLEMEWGASRFQSELSPVRQSISAQYPKGRPAALIDKRGRPTAALRMQLKGPLQAR